MTNQLKDILLLRIWFITEKETVEVKWQSVKVDIVVFIFERGTEEQFVFFSDYSVSNWKCYNEQQFPKWSKYIKWWTLTGLR